MLDSMRKHAGGWVAKIFILVLAGSFAVWGVADVFTGRQGDVLVTVGDVEITAEEYRTVFNRQIRAVGRQIGRTLTPDEARNMGLDRQILSQLIRDAALTAQAHELGLSVPNRAVADKIARDPTFHNSDGKFNAEDFRRLLTANGLSEGEFVASQRQDMLSGAISDALTSGMNAPEPLVQALWRHRSERRDAQYFTVDAGDVTVKEPSDAELREFYEENPKLFEVPERRQIAIMHVDPAQIGQGIDIPDEEIAAAYERRKGEFGTPERRVIQMIPFADAKEAGAALERIRGGAQFLDIAKDKGLSEKDATLGELTREGLPDPAFAEAAFALEEGQVSEPVEGRLSTALLRVTDIVPAEQKPLTEVRDELVKLLQTESGRERVLDVYDEVEDGRAAGQSFEDIAANLGVEVRTFEIDRAGTDAEGKTIELPASAEVLRTAFDLDVGVEADPISTPEDGFVWIDVRDVKPAAVRKFEDAREDAVKVWKERKTSEAVLAKARELKQQAESGTPLEDLARQVGSEVKTVSDVARGSQSEGFDRAAADALFSAPEGGYAVAKDGSGSAKVIKSSPVLAQPFDMASEDAKQIGEVVEMGLSEDLSAQYSAALQSNLEVEIDEALWQRVSSGQI